ncbi:MAG TPA: pitrilysin family protein [Pyrinomonadaceae bacterium]|nr:pitrilysin family protein [Pyrinomonadaceae bacterium]
MTTVRLATIMAIIVLLALVVAAQTQTTPPLPSTPRSVSFPKPIERTLPNGLRVIVVERHNTPLVSAMLVIKNGGEVDPLELAGVSDLTANLLTKGTTTRSATRIAQEVEGLGGLLDSGAQWDSSRVSVGVMSEKIGPAMSILADVARQPTFKNDEIERLRQQYIDSLTLALDEPGSIARFVGTKVLYGDGPYGHPISGTLESLKRISRSDILKIHRLFYRPDNAILLIGGDINSTAGFSLATRFFGGWLKPRTPVPTLSAANKATDQRTGRVVVIDKPDAGQAAVFLIRRGIDRKDSDYYRGIVTNSVLNGYSGRLNQEIRIKRGLSYGAGSSLDARRNVGPFVAVAQTKNESGAEVADLLKSEVERLSSAPPADAELTPRKAVLIGDFSRNLETVNGLVSRISSLALHGLSLDEINRYIDNVQRITAADVQRFANMKLDAKSSDIIIVGNSKAFLPDLQKRYANVEVIPFAELDLNTRLLKKKQVQ